MKTRSTANEHVNRSVDHSFEKKGMSGSSQLTDNRKEAAIQQKFQTIAVNNGAAALQRKFQTMAGDRAVAALQQSNGTIAAAPIQLSRGSKQANEELRKQMGKSGSRVNKLPNAKPHTKHGTGGGGGGTDHQARNAQVINKAKQDTMHAQDDPTMFSASRMRTDDNAVVKDAAAAEKRTAKSVAKKQDLKQELSEYYEGKPYAELTKDEIDAYMEIRDM